MLASVARRYMALGELLPVSELLPWRKVGNSGAVGSAASLEAFNHSSKKWSRFWWQGSSLTLPPFSLQPHPAAALLNVVVLNLHSDDNAHTGEGVTHEADQGAITEAHQRAGVDGIVQHAQTRPGLAFLDAVLGAAHGVGGIGGDDWPVISQSNSIRAAAKCCLTVGLERLCPSFSIYAATWMG